MGIPPQLSDVNLYRVRATPYTPPPVIPPPIPVIPPPVSPPPVALAVAAAIAGATILVTLNAFLDLKNAENSLQKARNNAELVNSRPVNTGNKVTQGTPPFYGGQSSGVPYAVTFERFVTPNTGRAEQSQGINTLTFNGKILGAGVQNYEAYGNSNCIRWVIYTESFPNGYAFGSACEYMPSAITGRVNIISVVRIDAQPDLGNPPAIGGGDPIPEGYTGDRSRDRNRVPPPTLQRSPNPSQNTTNNNFITNNYFNNSNNSTSSNSNTSNPTNNSTNINTGNPQPQSRTATPPAPTPTSPPAPKTTPPTPKEPEKKEEKKVTPPPETTPPSDSQTILQRLAAIGAILGIVNANTQPESQRLNAKNGSCDALNSPSCTNSLKNDIVNPLFGKLDAAQIARDGIAFNSAVQFAAIADNFTKVKNFLNSTIVDRAIGAANFAMNVHNALMLSNNLAKTVVGTIDTAFNLGPFGFTDANTGQRTNLVSAFGRNTGALLINLIGEERWVELTDDWKVANRIYQSSTNLLNKTERLLSGQSKVAQKSGIDVANIGNALRANGIVNPNSYPPMAATKEANTPTELLADVNSPLSSLGSGVRNLNAIAKNVNGTLRQVSGIQKEFGKLQNLTNKESKVRKSLRTASANEAKRKAKFTFLQIKTIQRTGKR